MKLHALDRKITMSECHDHVVRGGRCDLKRRWHSARVNNQGVVPSGSERAWKPVKHSRSGMDDLRGPAMHHLWGSDNRCSEDLGDALVAKADTENRHAASEHADHVHTDAGVLWPSRPGRDKYTIGCKVHHPVDVDCIVTHDCGRGAQFAQVLHEVVREGIIVVHDEYPWCHGPDDIKLLALAPWHFTYPAGHPPGVRSPRLAP